MRTRSSFRFAPCAAALLMAGCGGVIDERQSSGGASGSGSAGVTVRAGDREALERLCR
jgi:hypothetical protein